MLVSKTDSGNSAVDSLLEKASRLFHEQRFGIKVEDGTKSAGSNSRKRMNQSMKRNHMEK